ncbi:hypothetical protein H0H92_010097 [Tricholoma furcatifolium]|nr:hypothetical protein H0H92_010097 [Tricholoma furcatifolium]
MKSAIALVTIAVSLSVASNASPMPANRLTRREYVDHLYSRGYSSEALPRRMMQRRRELLTKLESRGCINSKEPCHDSDPHRPIGDPKRGDPKHDSKVTAKYNVGSDNRSEKAEGSRGIVPIPGAGTHDDYFGNWEPMVKGVHNPASGLGKPQPKERRGLRDFDVDLD